MAGRSSSYAGAAPTRACAHRRDHRARISQRAEHRQKTPAGIKVAAPWTRLSRVTLPRIFFLRLFAGPLIVWGLDSADELPLRPPGGPLHLWPKPALHPRLHRRHHRHSRVSASIDTIVTAETPEGIAIVLHPAGFPVRCIAFIIDGVIRARIPPAACAQARSGAAGSFGGGLMFDSAIRRELGVCSHLRDVGGGSHSGQAHHGSCTSPWRTGYRSLRPRVSYEICCA